MPEADSFNVDAALRGIDPGVARHFQGRLAEQRAFLDQVTPRTSVTAPTSIIGPAVYTPKATFIERSRPALAPGLAEIEPSELRTRARLDADPGATAGILRQIGARGFPQALHWVETADEAFKLTLGRVPDKEAKIQFYASLLPEGLGVDFVRDNFEAVERDYLYRDFRELALDSRRLAEWAANPNNMMLAWDSGRHLAGLKNVLVSRTGGVGEHVAVGFKRVLESKKRGLIDTLRIIDEFSNWLYIKTDEIATGQKFSPEKKRILAKRMSNTAMYNLAVLGGNSWAEEEMSRLERLAPAARDLYLLSRPDPLAGKSLELRETASELTDEVSGFYRFAVDLPGSTADLVSQAVLGMFNPAIPLGLIAAQEGGSLYAELRDQGVSGWAAISAALPVAGINVLLERAQLNRVRNLLGIRERLSREALSTIIRRSLIDVVENIAQETAQNMVTTAGTLAGRATVENLTLKQIFNEMGASFKEGLYEGLLVGASSAILGTASLGSGMRRVTLNARQRAAFEAAIPLIEKMPLYKRDPAKLQQAVDAMLDGKDASQVIRDVGIDAQIFERMVPESLREETLRALGVDQETYNQALAENEEIRFTTGAWVTVAPTEIGTSLFNHIRLGTDGLTVAEEQQILDFEVEVAADRAEIFRDMLTQHPEGMTAEQKLGFQQQLEKTQLGKQGARDFVELLDRVLKRGAQITGVSAAERAARLRINVDADPKQTVEQNTPVAERSTMQRVSRSALYKQVRDQHGRIEASGTQAFLDHINNRILIPEDVSEGEANELIVHERAHEEFKPENEEQIAEAVRILGAVRRALAGEDITGEIDAETVRGMRPYLEQETAYTKARLLEEAYAQEIGRTHSERLLGVEQQTAQQKKVDTDLSPRRHPDGPVTGSEVAAPPEQYFQLGNLEEWMRNTEAWMKKNDYSEEEIQAWRTAVEGQMKAFSNIGPIQVEMMPKSAGVPARIPGITGPAGPFRPNSDPIYKITYDASAMCVKRLEAAATANEVQRRIGRALTTSERMALVALFRGAGKQAPCLYCYVEAPRAKSGEFVKVATDTVFGKIPINRKWSEGTKNLAKEAVAEAKRLGLSERDVDPLVLLDPEYGVTQEAIDKVAAAPAVYRFLRAQFLAAKSNLPKLYEGYTGQILNIRQDMLDALNQFAGLRFFSSSDFQVEHVVDLIQAFVDMDVRGVKSHAYTKVPSFVEIFGKTGMKIQTSIFASVDEAGKVIEDSTQGMEWAKAREFRRRFPNVGTVLVASDDRIVQWGLAQKWIDYILPFHYSGLEKKFYGTLGWQDFTQTQSEKAIEKGAEVTKIRMHEVGTARGLSNEEATRRYLRLALKRNLYPVFPAFLFKDYKPAKTDKDRVKQTRAARERWAAMVRKGRIDWAEINPNYFKLRKDYARSDKPFDTIDSTKIDIEQARTVLDEYFRGEAPKAQVDATIADELERMITEAEDTGRDIGVEMLERTKSVSQTTFQQQTRGAITFTGQDIDIDLFKGTWDKTTPIHELGHIALKLIQESVESGIADDRTLAEYYELLRFAGGAFTKRGVERIINEWEAYLMEGKAPAVELAEPFARFKNWMLDIYHTISNKLGGPEEVAPEMRQIFNAWLASEQEVELAEAYYRTYEAASDILLKDKDEKLEQIKAKAQDERERKIREAVRIRLAEWMEQTGGRAGILAEATREIDERPIYQAIGDTVKLGGMSQDDLASYFTGTDLPALIDALRVKHGEQIVAADDKPPLNKTFDAFLGWSTDVERRSDLENIADRYAFEDPRAMVLQMRESPSRQEAIDTRASEIEAQHARIIRAEVEADTGATHNEVTLDLLMRDIARLEALERGRVSDQLRRAKLKALRQQTRDELRKNLNIRDASQYRRWAAREAEYARKAVAAARRGDGPATLDARRRQLKFHVAILESIAIRDEHAKLSRQLQGRTLEGRLKNTEADYANLARDLVFSYRLNDTTLPALGAVVIQEEEVEGVKQYRLIDRQEDQVIGEFATRGEALTAWRGVVRTQALKIPTLGLNQEGDADLRGILLDLKDTIPTWVQEKWTPLNYLNSKDLTFEQFEELHGSVQRIMHEGSQALTALKSLGVERVEEILDRVLERMGKLPEFRRTQRDVQSVLGKAGEVSDWFAAYMTKMEFLLDAMDGYPSLKGERAGPMGLIFDLVSLAESNYDNILDKHMRGVEGIPGLQQAYVRLAKAAEQVNAQRGEFFDIPGVPIPAVLREVKGWRAWTFERALAVVLNMGNDANRGPLQKSVYQFTDEQLDAIASVLPSDALRAVQDVWDSIDVYDDLARVTYNVTFQKPPKEEPMAFTVVSADGEEIRLRGGYYPLRYDGDLDPDAARWNERSNVVADLFNQTTHQRARPDSTASKARVRDENTGESLSSRPPDLSLGVLVDRFTKTVRQITHMELLYDLQRLTTNRDFYDTFVRKFGLAQYKQMRQWLNRTARPERKLKGPMNRTIEALRSLHTVSALGLRVITSGKQALSAANAVQAMNDGAGNLSGYKYLASGASAFITNPSGIIEFVQKVDPFMKARASSVTREMRDFTRKIDFAKGGFLNKIKQTRQWCMEVAFFGIRAVDALTTYSVWMGAYKQALDLGLEGVAEAKNEIEAAEAAIRYARRICRTTQPTGLPTDLAGIQAEEGVARLFTQFMSFKSVDFNRFMHRVAAVKRGQIGSSKMIGYIINERLIPAMALLVPAFLFYHEDEKPKWWEFFIRPGTDLLAGVPLLNQAIGTFQYGRVAEIPIMQGITRARKSVDKFRRGKVGEGAYEAWRTLEWFTGVPFTNPIEDARRLYKKAKRRKRA